MTAWTTSNGDAPAESEGEHMLPGHEQDSQQIAAIIEQYRRGFATLDVAALTGIWDQNYDQIIYIAQEMAQPAHGWAGVERYYQGVAGFLEQVKTMEVSDVS